MGSANFLGLYSCAFLFGVFLCILYDIMWVIRVSFLRNRFVWLTDILATLSAGILISVLQYNFSSGKFRFLPYLIFPLGVLFVRLTFSRLLRYFINKLVCLVRKTIFKIKISVKSFLYRRCLLFKAGKGFSLMNKYEI